MAIFKLCSVLQTTLSISQHLAIFSCFSFDACIILLKRHLIPIQVPQCIIGDLAFRIIVIIIFFLMDVCKLFSVNHLFILLVTVISFNFLLFVDFFCNFHILISFKIISSPIHRNFIINFDIRTQTAIPGWKFLSVALGELNVVR